MEQVNTLIHYLEQEQLHSAMKLLENELQGKSELVHTERSVASVGTGQSERNTLLRGL
jgi:ribosomal protein L29